MEEVLNPTKLNYIDETIFVSAVLCYTIWRIKNRFNVVKLFKLHLRECAIFLLFTSVLMSFVYNLSVAFLNNIYEIDKYYLEKIGHLEGVHNVMIFNRMIDMIWVMNYTFNISAMLKMSAMFMLISLWSPCVKAFLRNENMFANDSEANFKDLDIYTSKSVSQASIITFATLYSFIRIPISFILDLNWEYAPEKTMIFYRSVFYGSEMYLAVLFFLILETRFLSQNSKKPVQLVNLMIIIMTLDALIRYYINIINIPVEFNSVTVHVLNKVGFLSQMGIYMLMINFLCPLETQLYEAKQASPKLYLDTKPKLQFDNDNSIVLAKDINNEYSRPSIIEFGEYKSELMHSK